MGLLQHPVTTLLLVLIVYNVDTDFNGRYVVATSAGSSINNQNKVEKDSGKEEEYTIQQSLSNSSSCRLRPAVPGHREEIADLYDDGAKLITYHLKLDGYDVNPLLDNLTKNYKSDLWKRTFDNHGRTLLTLPFNYDVISLFMLTFGVEEMDIKLQDEPRQCFGNLTENEKISALLEMLVDDFQQDAATATSVSGEAAHVCHQVIKANGNQGRFRFRCCRRRPQDGRIECIDNEARKWIRFLYAMIVFLKLMTLLFGPVFFSWEILSESIRKTVYVLKLKETLYKTLYIAKAAGDSEIHTRQQRQKYKMFRRTLATADTGKEVKVRFNKLHIQVDHRKLMTQRSVPVGVSQFLFEHIMLCRLRNWYPFKTCCAASICGSWTPRFLWFGIKQDARCKERLGYFPIPKWDHIFMFLSGLVILVGLPLPYYIRLAIYFIWEEEELISRRNALDILGLGSEYTHNILHIFSPTHPVLIFFYSLYGLCFILLAIIHFWKPGQIDDLVISAVHDMRRVKRRECLRLVVALIILPFEKFGILGGLSVGILFYWFIATLMSLLVVVAYCIPLVYLSGRFLIHKRLSFLYLKPLPTSSTMGVNVHPQGATRDLSAGTSSFETALLIDNVSPWNTDDATNGRENYFKVELNHKEILPAFYQRLAVGFLCICLMFSLLGMCADVFGLLVEMIVFTLMGAIVNAGRAARYLMLAFWIVMYSSACFNNVYDQYMALNAKIFDCLKDKLGKDIKHVTLLREEKQQNTAFKYFTRPELRQQVETEQELDSGSDDDEPEPLIQRKRDYDADDMWIVKNGQLEWNIKCLVFFVDNEDVPRIPKELFLKICKIQAPGCPGPVPQSLLRATKQLTYMILFLMFVMIIVMSFGKMNSISTTNQMLMTLASGFIPFVVRDVIKPKKPAVSFGTYSFEGKVHNIIRNFRQSWSVHDLHFKVVDEIKLTSEEDAGDHAAINHADDNAPGSLAVQGNDMMPDMVHNIIRNFRQSWSVHYLHFKVVDDQAVQTNNDRTPPMVHLLIGFGNAERWNKESVSEWDELTGDWKMSSLNPYPRVPVPYAMNVNMSEGTVGFPSSGGIEDDDVESGV